MPKKSKTKAPVAGKAGRGKTRAGGFPLERVVRKASAAWRPFDDASARLPKVAEEFVSEASRRPSGLRMRGLDAVFAHAETAPAGITPPGLDRTIVQEPNSYPWSAHVMLEMITADGQRRIGSGWVVGPRTIITAGHCVYENGWMQRITVIPGGWNSGFPRQQAVHYNTTAGWLTGTPSVREASDVGVILVADAIEHVTGSLRFAAYSDQQLAGLGTPGQVSIAGFAANPTGTYYVDGGRLNLQPTAVHLFYDMATVAGESGAPVLHWAADGLPTVIGVHHWFFPNGVARAVRLTTDAVSLLLNWRV